MMFDLEAAIRQWRHEMTEALRARATGDAAGDVVDELESHLREEIARAALQGQSAEAAWPGAVARLGMPAPLAAEFAKEPDPSPLRWIPGWVCTAICLFVAVLFFAIGGIREIRGILFWHVFFVTLGYLATMIFGALSACWILYRLVGGMSPRESRWFRWWGTRFAGVAAAFCIVGVVLGSVWASTNLGAAWSNDPRELGGLAMIAWNILAAVCLSRPQTPDRLVLMAGIVGNVVTGLAWFVAYLLVHPAAAPGWWTFLSIYFGGNGLMLILACIRPGQPRTRESARS